MLPGPNSCSPSRTTCARRAWRRWPLSRSATRGTFWVGHFAAESPRALRVPSSLPTGGTGQNQNQGQIGNRESPQEPEVGLARKCVSHLKDSKAREKSGGGGAGCSGSEDGATGKVQKKWEHLAWGVTQSIAGWGVFVRWIRCSCCTDFSGWSQMEALSRKGVQQFLFVDLSRLLLALSQRDEKLGA